MTNHITPRSRSASTARVATTALALALAASAFLGSAEAIYNGYDYYMGSGLNVGYTYYIENYGASLQGGERQPCAAIGSTLWYTLYAPNSGTITLEVTNANFDTALAVYRYTGSISGDPYIGCDDDSAGNLRSRLQFTASAGTTYAIQVGGYNSYQGWMYLSISQQVQITPPSAYVSVSGSSYNGYFTGTPYVSYGCSSYGTYGCSYYQSYVDGVWQGSANGFYVYGEGSHSVQFRAVDPYGNAGNWQYQYFTSDFNNPSISATVSPPMNANGWQNVATTVSFGCTDSVSGVQSVTGSQTVSSNFNGQVAGSCMDRAGRWSYAYPTVRTDFGAPVASSSLSGAPDASGWYTTAPVFSQSCSDAFSGVQSNELNQDSAGFAAFGGAFTVADGSHSLVTRCTDRAGNAASVTRNAQVDTLPPELAIGFDGDAGNNGWWLSPVNVTFTCTDLGSGVAAIEHEADGAFVPHVAPVTLGDEGENTLAGRCEDVAGKSTTDTAVAFVDTVAPDATITQITAHLTGATINATASDATSKLASATLWRLAGVTTRGPVFVGVCTVALDGAASAAVSCEDADVDAGTCYELDVEDVAGNVFTAGSGDACSALIAAMGPVTRPLLPEAPALPETPALPEVPEDPTTLVPPVPEDPTTLVPTVPEDPTTLVPSDPTTLVPPLPAPPVDPVTLVPTVPEDPTTLVPTPPTPPTVPEDPTTLVPTVPEDPTTLVPAVHEPHVPAAPAAPAVPEVPEDPTTLIPAPPTLPEDPTSLLPGAPEVPEAPAVPDPMSLIPPGTLP